MVNIIGIGNPQMGDDGIGPILIRKLQNSLNFKRNLAMIGLEVKLYDATQDPVMAGAIIAEGKPTIIIDAVEMGRKPGDFCFFKPNEITARFHPQSISTHGFDLAKILELADTLGFNNNIFILGVQIGQTDFLNNLSPVIEEKVTDIITKLFEEVKRIA